MKNIHLVLNSETFVLELKEVSQVDEKLKFSSGGNLRNYLPTYFFHLL